MFALHSILSHLTLAGVQIFSPISIGLVQFIFQLSLSSKLPNVKMVLHSKLYQN